MSWNSQEVFQLPVDLLDLPYKIRNLCGKPVKKSSPNGDFEEHTILPLFDRVLQIGVRDIHNLWLVTPELVEQARTAYHDIYREADEQQRAVIDRAIESFVGTWEDFDQLRWCCVIWASGSAAYMKAYPSFQRYLERLVASSMESR